MASRMVWKNQSPSGRGSKCNGADAGVEPSPRSSRATRLPPCKRSRRMIFRFWPASSAVFPLALTPNGSPALARKRSPSIGSIRTRTCIVPSSQRIPRRAELESDSLYSRLAFGEFDSFFGEFPNSPRRTLLQQSLFYHVIAFPLSSVPPSDLAMLHTRGIGAVNPQLHPPEMYSEMSKLAWERFVLARRSCPLQNGTGASEIEHQRIARGSIADETTP